MTLGWLVLVPQLVDCKSLEDVQLEGEGEIILEEVVAALGVELGSMGIYFLVGEESKEARQCSLDKCQLLKKWALIEAVCFLYKGLYWKE